MQPRLSPNSSSAKVLASNIILGTTAIFSFRVSRMTRPVASPWAWRIRLRLCAPSPGQSQAGLLLVKGDAQVDEAPDFPPSLHHQLAHCFGMAQAGAGRQGILKVQVRRVLGHILKQRFRPGRGWCCCPQGCLWPAQLSFSRFGSQEGGIQSCQPGAYNDNICIFIGTAKTAVAQGSHSLT